MATYAQLASEAYWGREVVTPELDWLGDELCRRTTRPKAAFGVKGDNNHLRGAHRSQEWILKSRFCTNRTYTVQPGLTAAQQRHIAGVDFTPGSVSQMVTHCKRIYAAMRAGQLDEVREFYGNVDGDRVVDGWDNVRDRAASSDSSHLWHWHLTIDRRHCTDRRLMERILAITLGDPTEDDIMPALTDAEQKELLAGVRALRVICNVAGYRVAAMIGGADRYDNQMGNESAINVLGQQIRALVAGQQAILAASEIDPAEVDRIVNALPVPPTAAEIADETVARLGGGDLDVAADALRAAFGDRLPELVARLATPAGG